MNLGALLLAAHRRAPAAARGTITFTDPVTNRTTSAQATGTPPSAGGSAASADEFAAGTVIREKHRRVSIPAASLAFAPKSGHLAQWEGADWRVLGVSPLAPNGTVVLYRVTLGR